MDRLIQKARTIKILGIIGLSILPFAIILLIISHYVVPTHYYWAIGLLVTGIILCAIAGPLCLTASIMVLAIHWDNQELDEAKLLWGLLGLFIIPGIAPIVFSCKAQTELVTHHSYNDVMI